MIIKTRAVLTEAVLAETKRLHPYQLPALLVLPTEGGSAEYCGWIVNKREARAAMSDRYVLAIDQGTTSTRAIPFDDQGDHARPRRWITQTISAGGGRAPPGGDFPSVLQAGRAALAEIQVRRGLSPSASPISAR